MARFGDQPCAAGVPEPQVHAQANLYAVSELIALVAQRATSDTPLVRDDAA